MIISAKEKNKLETLIRSAGGKLMEYWKPKSNSSNSSSLGIQTKGDGSFVTQADLESNEIIVSGLQKIFPDDGILSEELPADEGLLFKQRVWIIDPLDGTQSFIHGNDDFSVLVSLVIAQTPVLGFLYFPAREQFAMAEHKGGAFLNQTRLCVSKSQNLRKNSVYVRHIKLKDDSVVYNEWMDSGCALLALSQGEFDGIIIKIVNHREWDLAAPTILIQESGGVVSDENNLEIAFNKRKMDYKYFIASNGITHTELLNLIPSSDRQTI